MGCNAKLMTRSPSAREKCMSKPEIRWPPQVGDHVQIVATGAPVVVIDGSAQPRHDAPHRHLPALSWPFPP